MGEPGRVRPPATLFHVGELVTQGCDAALGKLSSNRGHERVRHAGARAMRQHIAGPRASRHQQQARDPRGIANRDHNRLCVGCRHGRSRASSHGSYLPKAAGIQQALTYILWSCHGAPTMCRNIRTLFNFEPPATEDEVRASALQFVRKLSGFTEPSKANAAAFDRAVDEVSQAARKLISSLETARPPRNREIEAMKAKERSRARFA